MHIDTAAAAVHCIYLRRRIEVRLSRMPREHLRIAGRPAAGEGLATGATSSLLVVLLLLLLLPTGVALT